MTKRINLDLGPNSYEALKNLQNSLETASQAETIRFALQTLEKLVEEIQQGARVTIERARGEKVEVLLPGVKRKAATVKNIADSPRRKSAGA